MWVSITQRVCYNSPVLVNASNPVKTLIFSDTHLHKEFEEEKFLFLKKIISEADRVIIAGDFWEAKLMTFDEFVNSFWNQLFPLLKKKNTVYIYGNHDKKELSDKRVSLFSDIQTDQYKFTSCGKTFVVEHGNRFFSKFYYLAFTGIGKYILPSKFTIKWIHSKLEKFLTRTYGKEFIQKRFRKFNNEIKMQMRKEFTNDEILICGHTHAAEIDLKHNFINTGIIRHGIAQYVVIDGDDISLHEEWYENPKKN